MSYQLTLLAWVFLGEQLTWQKVMGMAIASPGTLVVQTHTRPVE